MYQPQTAAHATAGGPSHQFQPPVFDPNNVHQSLQQRHQLLSLDLSSSSSSAAAATATPTPTKRARLPLPRALPPVRDVQLQAAQYVGPTPESNWVILDRLMVGAYPASTTDDQENDDILLSILQCGVSTFVCLQHEYVHGAPEEMWRTGHTLRPYIDDALAICHRTTAGGLVSPHNLKFLHHGIVDCGTTHDSTVLELAVDVCNRLLGGEVIYLHCWGGHGRTGTVVAVALGLLYGLTAREALMRTQLYHDLRTCNLNVPSPQTPQQRDQVVRILASTATHPHLFPRLPMIANYYPASPLSMPSPRFEKKILGSQSFAWPMEHEEEEEEVRRA